MVVATLLVKGLMELLIAATFVYVGHGLRRRLPASPDSRLAARAFLAWWYGLGIYIGILGVQVTLASMGMRAYPVFLAARIVNIPFIAAAVAGMVTYVAFMHTGRSWVWKPAVAYAALLAALYYTTTSLDADGTLLITEWRAELAEPPESLIRVVYAGVGLPLIASILAYAALLPQTQSPEQRYRIAMVSTSLLLWVGSGLVGESSGDGFLAFATVAGIGTATSIVMLLAYRPPRPVRAWLDRREAAALQDG